MTKFSSVLQDYLDVLWERQLGESDFRLLIADQHRLPL